jgi:hypothetical protein
MASRKARNQATKARKHLLPGRCAYVLDGPDGREDRAHDKKANAVKAARTLVRKHGGPVDVMKLCMNRTGTSRKNHDISVTSCLEGKSGKVVCKTIPRQKARQRPSVTRVASDGSYVTRRMNAREAALRAKNKW